MFSIEGLQQQLAQYQAQQKQAEQLYQQCAGVIALLNQQINLLNQYEEAKKVRESEDGEAHEQAEEQTAEK